MNIFKCDRCKEIQGDSVRPSGSCEVVALEDRDTPRVLELCSKCWNNLKMWLGGYNNAKPIDAIRS